MWKVQLNIYEVVPMKLIALFCLMTWAKAFHSLVERTVKSGNTLSELFVEGIIIMKYRRASYNFPFWKKQINLKKFTFFGHILVHQHEICSGYVPGMVRDRECFLVYLSENDFLKQFWLLKLHVILIQFIFTRMIQFGENLTRGLWDMTFLWERRAGKFW